MSRGLGKLQRDILNTFGEAREYFKSEKCRYRGMAWGGVDYLIHNGREIKVKPYVYDLRASLKYLALKYNRLYGANYVDVVFQASFSRAVKLLIERGLIQPLSMIPLDDVFGGPDMSVVHSLSDGLWAFPGRQIRFIAENISNGEYT